MKFENKEVTASEIAKLVACGSKHAYAFTFKAGNATLRNSGKTLPIVVFGIFAKNAVGDVFCYGDVNMIEQLSMYCSPLPEDISILFHQAKDGVSDTIYFLTKDGENLVNDESYSIFALYAIVSIPGSDVDSYRFYDLSKFKDSDEPIFISTDKDMLQRALSKNFFLMVYLFGNPLLKNSKHSRLPDKPAVEDQSNPYLSGNPSLTDQGKQYLPDKPNPHDQSNQHLPDKASSQNLSVDGDLLWQL